MAKDKTNLNIAINYKWDYINNINDLEGKKVGIYTGSEYDQILSQKIKNAIPTYYNSYTDEVMALKSGKIDAFLADEPLAKEILKNFSDLKMLDSYLTKDMIRKYKDKLNWSHICAKQSLGPEFMEEMEEYLDWETVSMFQEMPYRFIEKYKNKLNMKNILRYHYLVFPEEELKKLKEEYGKADETEVN